jgi:hypothetical protein
MDKTIGVEETETEGLEGPNYQYILMLILKYSYTRSFKLYFSIGLDKG